MLNPESNIAFNFSTVGLNESVLSISLGFKNARHDLRQEYIVYDGNSFIADVGGFLGLLLGYSILGIFESIVKLQTHLLQAQRTASSRCLSHWDF